MQEEASRSMAVVLLVSPMTPSPGPPSSSTSVIPCQTCSQLEAAADSGKCRGWSKALRLGVGNV